MDKLTPRAELRDRLHRIGYAMAPHMSQLRRIALIAALMSQDSGKPVGAGTVKDFWYALDEDTRTVDSRHMDWARARDRQICANDNIRASRPCSAEAVIGWAA